MRKKVLSIIMLSLLVLVGCSNGKTDSNSTIKEEENLDEIIEIKEKMFLTQYNDITWNLEAYENKVIKLEGVYCKGVPIPSTSDGNVFDSTDPNAVQEQINKPLSEWNIAEGTENNNFVFRKTPGCCGADGLAGFEFKYDGEMPYKGEMPKPNDWVEIVGDLIRDKSGNIFLKAKSIKVLKERGKEFVSQ